MTDNKHTGDTAATNASKTLRDDDTGADSKSAAGSALSQSSTDKSTSADAASSASGTLRDGRTSDTSKSAAGSALSQTPPKES